MAVLSFCFLSYSVQGLSAANCRANSITENHVTVTSNKAVWLETPTVASGTHVNMTCSWNVSGPPGHILFIGLDYRTPGQDTSWTVYNDSCVTEYMRVYDGLSASSAAGVLGTGCGDMPHAEGMFSSGSHVVIEVRTGEHANRTRVRFTVTAVAPTTCNKNLPTNYTASSSANTITSPYYSQAIGYPANTTCTWRISAPTGHVIRLNLYVVTDCFHGDHLEIYDGSNPTPENIIVKLCVRPSSGLIYSTSNSMVLRFISGPGRSRDFKWFRSWQDFKGFQATFDVVVPDTICSQGGERIITVLGPPPGVLASPNYPNTFPNDLDCYWRFSGLPGYRIKLFVHAVNLEGKNCNGNPSLRILDGLLSDSSSLWSAACTPGQKGHYSTFAVVSSGRNLGMHFRTSSDYPGVGFGFKLTYSFEPIDVKGSCGDGGSGIVHLRGQGSSFHSPNYSPYARYLTTGSVANTPCKWNITVKDGYSIQVDVLRKRFNSLCAQDNATYYDGGTAASSVLFTDCGYSTINTPRYTSGNALFVEYNSQSPQTRGTGFAASFKAVPQQLPKSTACSNARPERGIFLKGKNRVYLASYGYPNNYPYFAKCEWRVYASFAKVVRFTITSFRLEDSQNCSRDYVQVFAQRFKYFRAYASRTVQLANLCGTLKVPYVITSSGEYMKITFASDIQGDAYPGFEGYVEAIDDPSFSNCTLQGQDNQISLSSSSGVFSSPRFPRPFPSNMICTWIITVPDGLKVKVRLKPFSLVYNCEASVEIRDGPSSGSALLGKYCKTEEPPSVFSSGAQIWVRFVSRSFAAKGFYASYEAVNMCNKYKLFSRVHSRAVPRSFRDIY